MRGEIPSARCRSRVQVGVRVGRVAPAGVLVTVLLLTALPVRPAGAQTTNGPANVAPAGCTLSKAMTGTCIAGATLSNGAATAFNPTGIGDVAAFVCDAGVIANGLVYCPAPAFPAAAGACQGTR